MIKVRGRQQQPCAAHGCALKMNEGGLGLLGPLREPCTFLYVGASGATFAVRAPCAQSPNGGGQGGAASVP